MFYPDPKYQHIPTAEHLKAAHGWFEASLAKDWADRPPILPEDTKDALGKACNLTSRVNARAGSARTKKPNWMRAWTAVNAYFAGEHLSKFTREFFEQALQVLECAIWQLENPESELRSIRPKTPKHRTPLNV